MEGIHVAIAADHLGTFLGVPITNTLLMTWVVMAILFFLAFLLRTNLRVVPGKFQGAVEFLFTGVRDFIEETLENKERARKMFPLLMTLFLFILIGNWAEFIPGVESIRFHGEALVGHGEGSVPLLRGMNTDLNTTLALAIIAFLTIEVMGIVTLGLWKYAGKFFNFTSPINFFVGLLELLSEIIRLISFSFRLFGNIFAGSVLIAIVSFFLPYALPVPFMLFELFVGLIQAAVFMLLTLFFVKLATMDMEHAGH